MSGTTSDCPEVEGLAAELALGIVSGSERAAAVAHLNACPGCRRLVDELATAADPLLLLAPEMEPSIGFESRVLSATASAERPAPLPSSLQHRPVRSFTAARAAIAAAIALVAATGGLLVGRAVTDGGGPVVRTALAVVAEGKATCRAFAYGDEQSWVFVSLATPPEWTADYIVEITTVGGGRPAAVGNLRLQAGSGSMGAVVDVPSSRLQAVRVLDASGRLRYEAPFQTAS